MSGKVNKATLVTPICKHHIVPYDEGLFGRIFTYDNLVQHIKPREEFLRLWFDKDQARTAVAMAGDRVLGYGCIYPTYIGYRIGPLYADSEDIAANLVQALLEVVPEPEPTITMSVLNDHAGFKLAKELNLVFRSSNETAMCARDIQFRMDRVYAVCGLTSTFV
jgi:hypothetical protein